MKTVTSLLAFLAIVFITFNAKAQIIIDNYRYYVDEPRKLIVCDQLPTAEQITTTPIQIKFNDLNFAFANGITTLSRGVKYTLMNSGKSYSLYFTELPVINLQVPNTNDINQVDEIPGAISLSNNNGTPFNSNMAIRIRGNSSAFFPKKSYRVQLKDGAGKNKDESLLGLRSDKRWLFLALWNEEVRANNMVSHDLWIDMHKVYYQASEPKAISSIRTKYVEVFLNKSYLGVYALAEDMDRKQLALKKEDGGVTHGELYKADDWSLSSSFAGIGVAKAEPGSEDWQHWELEYPDYSDWQNHYNFLKSVIESTDQQFTSNIGNLMKIDNLIDYFIFTNLLIVEDNMEKNFFLARYDQGQPYFIIPWDLDATWSYFPGGNRSNRVEGERTTELYKRLFRLNPDNFKNKLATRWFALRQNLLTENNLKGRFTSKYNQLNSNLVYERESLVAQDQYGGANRSGGLNYIHTFITQRLVWLDNYFCPMVAGGNCNNQPLTCDFAVTAGPSNATPACSAAFTLTANCTGGNCEGVNYLWTGNGINQAGKTVNVNAPGTNGAFNYLVTASKAGCTDKTATTSITVSNCLPPVTGEPFSLCLEAETSNGNGPITGDPNASGGSTRGDKENYDHYVDYAVNGVKTTGVHQLKLRYYANGNAKVSIAVNGNTALASVSLPGTFSWNIVWREEIINVTLNQGNNTVRIQGLPGYSVRQDKICVTGDGTQGPENPVTCNFTVAPTSNKQNYAPQEAMNFSANCSGADCGSVTYGWTGNGTNATGASPSINAPAGAGDYTYTLTASKAGCANKTSNIPIHVVNNQPVQCDFAVTASPSNATPACSAAFTLTANCTGGNCEGVNYLWTGNGINQAGKSVNVNAPATNGAFNYMVTASKAGCIDKTATTSITVSNCVPPVTGEPFSLCLEAETSNGNGPITGDPNASGGSTRGDKENYNHYVDYAVNGVKTTGVHQLKLRYYANGNAKVSIAVNGNTALASVSLPATFSWNIVWREETINVTLNQGNNTVRIQGLPGYSVRQDKICMTGDGTQGPENPVTCNFTVAPTSNKQNYAPQEAMNFSANCSGADCGSVTYAWTGNGTNATGASSSINAPAGAGDYTYTLTASKAGCANKTSNITIHVVNNQPVQCDFTVTASPSNATPACSAAFTLTANCTGGNCEGVNYLWTGNGINQARKTVNVNASGTNGAFNYMVTASKVGCTDKTATTSITVSNCVPPVTGEPFSLCLEAETSNGNGSITGDPNASGGSTRGDKDNYNHYVDYAVNGVKSAGVYQLKLRYYASGNPTVSVSVNGNVVLPLMQLPSTYTWNIVTREEIINVTLAEGSNTVRIQGLPGPSCRQDKICVTGNGTINARLGAPEMNAQTTHFGESLTVYPNPSPSHFETKFNLETGEGTITVTDMRGKIWLTRKVKGAGAHQEQIQLNNAPAGIYILQIKKGNETEVKKLLLTK
jgi:hypothetical protein